MKTTRLMLGVLLSVAAARQLAQKPPWNPNVKECDRIFTHDPKAAPPLSIDVRMTENTGQMDAGEGMLWRSNVEPTSFTIHIADPVNGQVAYQGR